MSEERVPGAYGGDEDKENVFCGFGEDREDYVKGAGRDGMGADDRMLVDFSIEVGMGLEDQEDRDMIAFANEELGGLGSFKPTVKKTVEKL